MKRSQKPECAILRSGADPFAAVSIFADPPLYRWAFFCRDWVHLRNPLDYQTGMGLLAFDAYVDEEIVLYEIEDTVIAADYAGARATFARRWGIIDTGEIHCLGRVVLKAPRRSAVRKNKGCTLKH